MMPVDTSLHWVTKYQEKDMNQHNIIQTVKYNFLIFLIFMQLEILIIRLLKLFLDKILNFL